MKSQSAAMSDIERLREARTTKGWTQKEVAEHLGIPTQHYSLMERGKMSWIDGLLETVTNLAPKTTSLEDRASANGTLYKQAGNSMPVPILEEIFRQLRPYLVTQPSVLGCIGHDGIRRATVIEKIANTITTRQDRTPAQVVEIVEGLYRYLTERECWRLMGYSDEEYEAAKSKSTVPDGKMDRDLYKQAGNSMPVPVLEEIFRGLGIA